MCTCDPDRGDGASFWGKFVPYTHGFVQQHCGATTQPRTPAPEAGGAAQGHRGGAERWDVLPEGSYLCSTGLVQPKLGLLWRQSVRSDRPGCVDVSVWSPGGRAPTERETEDAGAERVLPSHHCTREQGADALTATSMQSQGHSSCVCTGGQDARRPLNP